MSREAILAALKPRSAAVELADFGVTVQVRMLSAGERDALLATFTAHKDKGIGHQAAAVVQLAATDGAGARLFPDGPEGYEAALALPTRAFDALSNAAMKLNGLSKEAAEDAEKN